MTYRPTCFWFIKVWIKLIQIKLAAKEARKYKNSIISTVILILLGCDFYHSSVKKKSHV